MKTIFLLIFTINITFCQNLLDVNYPHSVNNENKIFNQAVKFSLNQKTAYEGGKKSIPLAALYSLLLPGMGELYVGNYSSGKYFTVAEGLLWITLIGFDRYGTWVQNDARNFAAQHAGVNISGKTDRYFVDIGDYQNITDYNDEMLRNRQPYKMYDMKTAMWNWDSKSNRLYYRDLRISSDRAFNNVSFVAAAIGINHLVSAINAAMRAKSYNNSLSQDNYINIHASVMGGLVHSNGIMISFSKNF